MTCVIQRILTDSLDLHLRWVIAAEQAAAGRQHPLMYWLVNVLGDKYSISPGLRAISQGDAIVTHIAFSWSRTQRTRSINGLGQQVHQYKLLIRPSRMFYYQYVFNSSPTKVNL